MFPLIESTFALIPSWYIILPATIWLELLTTTLSSKFVSASDEEIASCIAWILYTSENFSEISLSDTLVPYLVLLEFFCLSTNKWVNLLEVFVFNVGLLTLTLCVTNTEDPIKVLDTIKLILFDCDVGLIVYETIPDELVTPISPVEIEKSEVVEIVTLPPDPTTLVSFTVL